MQFDDFSVLAIVQEDANGNRIVEEAVRAWPEVARTRPQLLGGPAYKPRYAPGTRELQDATISFSPPGAAPLHVTVRSVHRVSLMVGTGCGLEQDWKHGTYQGSDLVARGICYDLAKPEDKARMCGMVDAVAVVEYTEGGASVTGAWASLSTGLSGSPRRRAWVNANWLVRGSPRLNERSMPFGTSRLAGVIGSWHVRAGG